MRSRKLKARTAKKRPQIWVLSADSVCGLRAIIVRMEDFSRFVPQRSKGKLAQRTSPEQKVAASVAHRIKSHPSTHATWHKNRNNCSGGCPRAHRHQDRADL